MTPASAQRAASAAGGRARRARPAVDGDLAVAGVDRDDEPLAEPRHASARNAGESAAVPTMTRSAPAASATRSRRSCGSRRRPGPEAAGRGDALDEAERRAPGEGAVEIDEVEAAGALVAEPPRELDRVAALDRHRLAAALREPDDAALEDVDRRDDVEVVVLTR